MKGKRRPMSKTRAKKQFRKSAKRIHPKNGLTTGVYRGGIRF